MIDIKILPQPDDSTCGPTSLQAVYRYFGSPVPLEDVISSVQPLDEGGTLAVSLGIDALRRGFAAALYSFNLRIFDPTWKNLGSEELIGKLREQLKAKPGRKFTQASLAYIEFLESGGRILFHDLTEDLVRRYLARGSPLLTGLSATYLYDCKRERMDRRGRSIFDDVRGTPMGHFVVLTGITRRGEVLIADPYLSNPISGDHYYSVAIQRLINSIMLGIVTYDGYILVIEPRDGGRPGEAHDRDGSGLPARTT